MMAATRRMATLDFLLVAFSATVALLAFWPAAGPRQTIEYRDASGHVQRYSLAADDPRLKQLTQTAMKPSRPRPTTSLAKLKWLAETADYYVGRTEPNKADPGSVLPASFRRDQSATKSTREAEVLVAEQDYWIKLREESRQKVAEAEAKLRHQASLAVPPVILFGDVVGGGHSPSTLVVFALLGVSIAGLFALWAYACPAIRLHADTSSLDLRAGTSNRSQPRELRVVIPSRWVRVHQPIAVTVRRIAQTGVVAAGLACVIVKIW